MSIQNKRLVIILFSASFLLLLPFFAMQFTNQVDWNLFDFITAGALLFGTGVAIEFGFRRVKETKNRIVLFFVVLAIFLLVWAELAVGIFGTLFAGS